MGSLDLSDELHPRFLVQCHILNVDEDALIQIQKTPKQENFDFLVVYSKPKKTATDTSVYVCVCGFYLFIILILKLC